MILEFDPECENVAGTLMFLVLLSTKMNFNRLAQAR